MIKSILKNEEHPPKTKIKDALKDFFFNHNPRQMKYVKRKSYKIEFKAVWDLFPLHILPFFSIYKGERNIWLSFGWLFFSLDIDFISLIN